MRFDKHYELWRAAHTDETRPPLDCLRVEELDAGRAEIVRRTQGWDAHERVGLAVGCDGFLLCGVPVLLDEGDVLPALLPARGWKDAQKAADGRRYVRLEGDEWFTRWSERPYPDWRAFLKVEQRAASARHPRWKRLVVNPRLLHRCALACGLRDGEGFGLDAGRRATDAVYLSVSAERGAWDVVPPFAVVMPMVAARYRLLDEEAAG